MSELPLADSTSVEKSDGIYRIRHSLAHVMAQAVLELRPGSTLGFGPPIEDGFYYDFLLSEPLSDEDFPQIERLMKKIIKKDQKFYREELTVDEAFIRLKDMDEPYKEAYATELVEKNSLESLTFYRNGTFLDMCEGPHVESTKKIPRDAFKIRSIAGAYWRGDSKNVMMTRIYAWAFEDKKQLDLKVEAFRQAQLRDHKKLGRELKIFHIDNDIGRGLPLWLPNGTVIRDELEKLARELEFEANYQRVATPHIAKSQLYHETGHLPYYADGMYPPMELIENREDGELVKESYMLRSMNCPHHHKIFDSEPRSYRDLPLRLAEYGQVYRFEDSGAVGGLVRVRGMCMNDAHIYCTEEQLREEFAAVIDMYNKAYAILGLGGYFVRLSRWDPEDSKGKDKFIDNPEAWRKTEKILEQLLVEMNIDYVDGTGEAAFYGPKIDVQFPTVTGRDESVSTVQLDFAVPARLGLHYTGPDGADHVPYCIHRAPFSTHERMVAFLIEHFAGAFPTWLAPIQVRVLTVSNQFTEYGERVVERLRQKFIRAEMGSGGDTVSKKIREGTIEKIPNLLIVGEKETEEGTITLRRYGEKQQHTLSLDTFEQAITRTIETRALSFLLPKD